MEIVNHWGEDNCTELRGLPEAEVSSNGVLMLVRLCGYLWTHDAWHSAIQYGTAFWDADVCRILVLGCKQLPVFFTLEQRRFSLIPNGKEPCSLMNKVLDTRFYSANWRRILATVTHALTNSITDSSMCATLNFWEGAALIKALWKCWMSGLDRNQPKAAGTNSHLQDWREPHSARKPTSARTEPELPSDSLFCSGSLLWIHGKQVGCN